MRANTAQQSTSHVPVSPCIHGQPCLLNQCVHLVTALHAATEYGHALCVETLLDAGASADVADGEGNTPLMVAARTHAHDCVELLLSHGAGVGFENDAGMTALELAIHCLQTEGSTPELNDIVQALETAGSVFQETDGGGRLGGGDADRVDGGMGRARKKHWKNADPTRCCAAEAEGELGLGIGDNLAHNTALLLQLSHSKIIYACFDVILCRCTASSALSGSPHHLR